MRSLRARTSQAGSWWLGLMVLLAATLVPVVTPGTASANLTNNGKFVFYGQIQEGDPLNLLWFGGIDYSEFGGGAPFYEDCNHDPKSAKCVTAHARDTWKRGFMSVKHFPPGIDCNGGLSNGAARFYRASGASTGWVHPQGNVSTSDTCKRQFHMRVWDDSGHGHGVRVWDVAGIHHEDRGAFCTSQPIKTCNVVHRIDMGWETVENIAVEQFGHRQNAEPSLCTYPDYYPLHGTGPGNIHGWYSNGRISRISFQDNHQGCSGG
jgi:hypothetical protein